MGCGASKKYEAPAAEAKPEAATEPKPSPAAEAPAMDKATEEQLKEKADDPPGVKLAKCMGNLEYLRRELLTDITPARKAEIEAEVKTRKAKCKELRAKGVVPAPGVCVFNQIDLMKTRK